MGKLLSVNSNRIIMAAVSVFSRKGFKATTIADIAKKASRTEATIYNHFSSKEEILLQIPFIYINDLLEECEEHLQGIRSHEEKLRKFVWLYLWWIHNNFEYMKIYVLEIRSIPHYYDTKAYELIDQVSRIPTAILQSGKENGIFRADTNSIIFTNLLFGTIEWLFLAKVLFNRTMNLLDDYDIISDIIVSSVKIDARNNGNKYQEDLNKKERILIAAEELFFEKMFDETKISEIAKHANVADGTLYEYFANKEDILFSIFEKRMQEFSNSFDESIYPKQPETKLKYVIWHFLDWAQKNRQWVRIYFKDINPNPRFYASDKYKAMRDYDKKLKKIFLEGHKSKTFKPEINMFHFRALVFGTIDHIFSPWAMLNMQDNLNSKLDSIYDLIIRAITLQSVPRR